MKFIIINPSERSTQIVDEPDLKDAQRLAGLDGVDHGILSKDPGVAIVVYEFGLCEPGEHKYFAIGRSLYAGNAVLYGFDRIGHTIDVPFEPPINWLADEAAVEAAITAGLVTRPAVAVNGVVAEEWPNLHKPM